VWGNVLGAFATAPVDDHTGRGSRTPVPVNSRRGRARVPFQAVARTKGNMVNAKNDASPANGHALCPVESATSPNRSTARLLVAAIEFTRLNGKW
jgi:hypothetical protein